MSDFVLDSRMSKKRYRRLFFGLLIIVMITVILEKGKQETETTTDQTMFRDFFHQFILTPVFPLEEIFHEKKASGKAEHLASFLWIAIPGRLEQVMREGNEKNIYIVESDYEELIYLEGRDEEEKKEDQVSLEYDGDALHLSQELLDSLEQENTDHQAASLDREDVDSSSQSETIEDDLTDPEYAPNTEMADETYSEQRETEFVLNEEKRYVYKREELQDFDSVVKAFFAIDQNTRAYPEELSLDRLLTSSAPVLPVKDREGAVIEADRVEALDGVSNAQILIYHTHASEHFADSDPDENDTGIVGAGKTLADLLANRFGYQVIHYTQVFDETRDYAYTNALPYLEQIKEKCPSIKVSIDLHRDEMANDRHLITTIQGKSCAQYMFFCGMSRNRSTGDMENLSNIHRQDNLNFAFKLQLASNEYYPGIARRIYLKAYRYNLHLWNQNVLIELGAQNNTREEIANACEPLSHVIALVLSGKEPDKSL